MEKTQANAQKERLHKLYGVQIETVEKDDEYWSRAILLRTIREKIYFVSEESPKETGMATEILIRHHKLRTELMSASRMDKADENKKDLMAKIENIRRSYMFKHQVKKLSANKLAAILNEKNIASPNGKAKWYSETVKRVLAGPTQKVDTNK